MTQGIRVIFATLFLALLGACSAATTARIEAAAIKLEGEAKVVVAAVVAEVQKDCPIAVKVMPTAEAVTAFTFAVLGLPAVGTVAVDLQQSVALVCAKLVPPPIAPVIPPVAAVTGQ